MNCLVPRLQWSLLLPQVSAMSVAGIAMFLRQYIDSLAMCLLATDSEDATSPAGKRLVSGASCLSTDNSRT